jgi:hypothetical protein
VIDIVAGITCERYRAAIAHMATTVMGARISEGKMQRALGIGGVILEQFPRDGHTLIKRGQALWRATQHRVH